MAKQKRVKSTLQEVGDVLQLGDVVGRVAAVLLEEGEDVVLLAAGVGRIERPQLVVDDAPGLDLLLCVLHSGQRLARTVGLGLSNDIAPALPVLGVLEAGVVRIELGTELHRLLGKAIQIFQLAREPRDFCTRPSHERPLSVNSTMQVVCQKEVVHR